VGGRVSPPESSQAYPIHTLCERLLQWPAEARLRELVNEHLDLGREPQWDGGLADSGVSSLDAVAFKKVVESEFGVSIPPECFDTLRKLAAYIDSQAG